MESFRAKGMNPSADRVIFLTVVSAGIADICLLQKRDGKAEREATLAFCFCLLGVKEIQGLTQQFEKFPFPFPKSLIPALHRNVEED